MKLSTLAAAVALAIAGPVAAAPVTLTFEGVGDLNPVGSFYQQSYGITFSASALGLKEAAAGGSGNFQNEPSASTVMFFSGRDSSTVMNRTAGFVGSLDFYYSSLSGGSVTVFDGIGGTGNQLASFSLMSNATNCVPGSTAALCNFSLLSLSFSGTAQSVVFVGLPDQTLFDDISVTLASTGGGGVPEPMTLALVAAALTGAAAARRKPALKS